MSRATEKRVHPRLPLRTRVVFEDEFGEGLFYLNSENISLGGLFLSSDIPLKLGTLLLVSFTLPGHKRPVRVTAQVTRREKQGMGLKFVGLSELARRRIGDLLKLEPRVKPEDDKFPEDNKL